MPPPKPEPPVPPNLINLRRTAPCGPSAAQRRKRMRSFSVTNFQNIPTPHKTKPIRPLPPLADSGLFTTPSDNEVERSSRASGPPTRFRLRSSGRAPPSSLFATNFSGKPETHFRNRPHGLANAHRSRFLGRPLDQRPQRLRRRPRPVSQAGSQLPHARYPRLHLAGISGPA